MLRKSVVLADEDFADCGGAFGDSLLGTREDGAGFMDWFGEDNQIVFKLARQF